MKPEEMVMVMLALLAFVALAIGYQAGRAMESYRVACAKLGSRESASATYNEQDSLRAEDLSEAAHARRIAHFLNARGASQAAPAECSRREAAGRAVGEAHRAEPQFHVIVTPEMAECFKRWPQDAHEAKPSGQVSASTQASLLSVLSTAPAAAIWGV